MTVNQMIDQPTIPLEARAEEFVRKSLKPGTDEKTIAEVTAKVVRATQKALGQKS